MVVFPRRALFGSDKKTSITITPAFDVYLVTEGSGKRVKQTVSIATPKENHVIISYNLTPDWILVSGQS